VEADEDRELPSLGQLFADARERQGLSRTEIAQRLHMSAWQVEALEACDYARLPQGTFLRGFVRNYAKILAIDPDKMLEQLAESAPRGPAPRIVVPSQNIRFDPIGDRLSNPYVKAAMLAVVALAMGFAVMYWWLFIRPTPPASTLGPSPAQARGNGAQPRPQNLAAAPVPPPDPVVVRNAPSEPMKAEERAPVPAKAPEPVKAAEAKAAPKAEERKVRAEESTQPRLKLRFKGESWVEVKDRSGRVLLSKLNAPGSEAEVSGRPPFDVVIGNAPDVQVLYNDREFPLEPHTKVAVARFTVQ
jgi:cytoskeleton protein RodZ